MKVFIIAEAGMNHDGSFGNACNMIDVAKKCGADAIKFQTHISEAETLLDAPMPPYFKGEPRFEYFNRTAFSKEQWAKIKLHCDEVGIEFMSSPFSLEAIELLERIGIKKYKIPSGEVTNFPYLEAAAKTGKQVLLSSGMSSWTELDMAFEAINKINKDIIVMQCTSEYPCLYKNVGLNVMLEMRERYNVPVGLSDHTLTNYASFCAASLGAAVIEKHFTLSKYMYGSDAKHSLEPNDFEDFVKGIRAIETILSSKVNKDKIDKFQNMKEIFQKSVVSACFISKGTIIEKKMLAFKKPGTGISTENIQNLLGKRTKKNIECNKQIKWEDIETGD